VTFKMRLEMHSRAANPFMICDAPRQSGSPAWRLKRTNQFLLHLRSQLLQRRYKVYEKRILGIDTERSPAANK